MTVKSTAAAAPTTSISDPVEAVAANAALALIAVASSLLDRQLGAGRGV